MLFRRLILIAAALMGLLGTMPARAAAPTIAAASDLRLALTEVAAAFRRETGNEVKVVFGSSGNFARQLQQGAPFEMFLSADESYVLDLAKEGRTVDQGMLYAVGRLAIVAPKGSALKVDGQLAGLRAAMRAGRITRFAIANPEHAPYGARAQEALVRAGLWGALKGKLVMGENVSQAMQFSTTGGAQGGIVAYSLVLDPALKGRVTWALIPATWHAPLRQRMVMMKGAGATTRAFYAYMQKAPARRVLGRYGFTLPRGTG